MRVRGSVAVAVSILFAFANWTQAASDGRLVGLVSAKDGAPLGGVGIEVVNLGTGRTQQVKTDPAGSFDIALDAGSYALRPAPSEPYDVLRAPKSVVVAPGDTAHAELVLAKRDLPPAALGGAEGAGAATVPAASAAGGLGAGAIAGIAAVGIFAGAAILVTHNSGNTNPASQSPSR